MTDPATVCLGALAARKEPNARGEVERVGQTLPTRPGDGWLPRDRIAAIPINGQRFGMGQLLRRFFRPADWVSRAGKSRGGAQASGPLSSSRWVAQVCASGGGARGRPSGRRDRRLAGAFVRLERAPSPRKNRQRPGNRLAIKDSGRYNAALPAPNPWRSRWKKPPSASSSSIILPARATSTGQSARFKILRVRSPMM